MSFGVLADALGWVAIALGIWATFAQYRRVRELGPEGVSLTTWTVFTLMGLFWISYGVQQHSSLIVVGNVVLLPIEIAILSELCPWRRRSVLARSSIFSFLFCVAPAIFWGWQGGVYGTGVAMVINRGPQLLEVLRSREAFGVSAASWSISATASFCWVTYYAGDHLWPPFFTTTFSGCASVSIAVLAALRHRRHVRLVSLNVTLAQA